MTTTASKGLSDEGLARLAALEAEVESMKKRLERAEMAAGIQRGLDAADAGRMRPAREVLEEIRVKYNIPRA